MPYAITRHFESALCEYTGAPFAVAVNSCTAALLLCVKWKVNPYFKDEYEDIRPLFEIPSHTYVSVPCAILNGGGNLQFMDYKWRGAYELHPHGIWDCARRFTSGMYRAGQFQCVSFAASKILGAEQGGAILCDNAQADAWFRRMRFDGRTEGIDPLEDTFDLVGHHVIMIPSVAATLLVRLHHLPKHNEDLPHYEYPDLSKHPAFR